MNSSSILRPVRTRSIAAGTLAALLAALFAAQSALAAAVYWDGIGIGWNMASSWDTAVVPGAADVANFSVSTVTSAQTVNLNAQQSAQGLVFHGTNPATTALQGGGTNRTLTLGASGIQVDGGAGAVTIGSATAGQNVAIILAAAQTWTNNSANGFTIYNAVSAGSYPLTANGTGNIIVNGTISGLGSLTKAGAGTLVLSAANTCAGGTTLAGGTVTLGNAGALGTGTLTLSGGNLDSSVVNLVNANNNVQAWNANFTFVGTRNLDLGTGTVTLSANRQVTVSAGTLTVGGAIGGAFSLTKAGTGTMALTGANTYTGITTVSGGTLAISGSPTGNGAVTVNNGGTLQLDYSTDSTSKINDSAILTLAGGTLDLKGGSHTEIVASTTLTAGTASRVTSSSGTSMLQMNTITPGAGASIDFGAAGIATTDNPNNALGILGAWATIGGTDWAINSAGLITAFTGYTDVQRLDPGTITDGSATNVRIVEGSGFPGNITLAAATTTINTLNQSASGGNSAATIDPAGQTLRTNSILVGTGAGALTIGTGINNGTLSTATAGGELALVNNTANHLTINSVIADNSTSSLAKTGTGPMTLTAANTYTGNTTVNSGTLSLANASLNDAATLTIASGAVLNLTHGDTDIVGTLVIAGVTQPTGLYDSTNTGGTITGSGKIQVGPPSSAADILTFVFPGLPATMITGTAITVSVPCGTDVTSLSPTYTMSPGATGAPASGSTHDFSSPLHYLVTAQDGITTKDYTVTVTVGSTNPVNYAGLLHTALGSATLCVQSNQLIVGNLGTSGNDGVEMAMPANATGWQGTLAPLDAFPPRGDDVPLFLQEQIIGTAGPVTQGVLGTTTVTKAGTGDYVASADFSPLGASSVTVEVYSGNNLVAQKTATEATPGGGVFTNLLTAVKWPTDAHVEFKFWPLPPRMKWTWTYPANTSMVMDCESVSGDRVVVTPVVAFGVSAFSAVRLLASQIPSLTLTSETFTVAATWFGLYSGDWDLGTTPNWTAAFGNEATFHDGEAVLFDDSAIETTVNLTTALSPGMVTVDNIFLNYTFTGPGKLTGPGGLNKSGTGVLTVLTANDFTGGTIIDGGALQLGNGGTTGSLTGNIIDRGTLIWNRTDAVAFAGTISGPGTFTKVGTGTLTLTGVNTFSGPTTVSTGTLVVTGSLSASSAVSVAATGTLVLADNAAMNFVVGNASNNRIAGSGAVTLNGFCTIDTSAVTATTGSWTLVDTATLAASFGPTFAVAGADWTETANVWTKLEGAKTWTFSEASGVLTLSTVTGTILPVVTDFDHAANTATLTFESRVGFIYNVEFSTTLANASWSLLESVVAATTPTTVTDYYAMTPQRFYRVSCQGPLTGALTQLEPPQNPPGQPGGQSQPTGAAWPQCAASPSAQWAATRQPVPGTSPPGDGLPYLFSGEFHTTTTDLSIRGRGTDFVLTRSYRSKIGPVTAQGSGWDFSCNIRVEPAVLAQGSGFDVFNGNGRKDTYQLRPDGTYGADQLAHEGTFVNNVFTLKFADTGRWVFRAFDGSANQGKIDQSIDRNGNALTFQYATDGRLATVVDTLGRNIQIAYNADGLVQSVTDFAGRVVSYAYYQNGDTGGSACDLKSVTWPAVTGTPNGNDFPAGKTVTYTYSKGFTDERLNHNLLTITDAKGQTWLHNTYATTTNPADPDFDKLLRQVRGNPNEVTTFWYAAVSPTASNRFAVNKAIVNDGTGNVSELLFDAMNRLVRLREFTGRAVPGVTTTETQNRPTGKLRPGDPVFFETIQEWNVDSHLTRTLLPNGSSVVNTYELDLNPAAPPRLRSSLRERKLLPGPLGGDQASLVESWVYDTSFGGGCCGFNFVTAATDARGNITRHTYDSHGNRLTTTHPITSLKEDLEYNAAGQMTAHVHPDRGDGFRRRDTFTYHASGPQTGYLQQQVTDAAGSALTTAYEYDSAGNVNRVVDPRGYDTLYTVNTLNQLVRERSPVFANGSTVRYTKDFFYDANNNLVRGEVQNVDENGNLSTTNPTFTTTHDYDILNTLVRTTREVDPSHNVVTETAYDANRNPILVRDGQATSGADPFNTVTLLYDERNLVFREIRAQGSPSQATTQSDYDANRNLVRTSAGLESCPRITAAAFDGFQRRTAVTDPMGNVTTNHFDPNGNLLSTRVDGELNDVPGSAGNIRLAAATYTYDAMNRQTRSDVAHFTPQTQAPIGDGQATTLTSYDGNSQVTAVQDDNGHTTSTAYDTAGRPATKTDAVGDTVSFTYDPNGNVTTLIERDHGASIIATSFFTYDPLNRQVGTVNPLGYPTQAGYDSLNNRVAAVDERGNRVSYTYDGLNRMLQTTRNLTNTGEGGGTLIGTITTRQTWDDSSRLTSQADDNAHSTSYVYDALDRRIRQVFADGTANSTTYDVHGNPATQTDANGTVVNTSYDLLNRATGRTVTRAVGIEGNTFEDYQYDGQSRVVRAANDDTVATRAFDSLSKVSTETQQILPAGPVRTVTSTHDGVGNRLACTYPSGRVVNSTFDPIRRPLRITMPSSPLTYLANYTYVDRTLMIRDYGNGTSATNSYDLLGRMTGAQHENLIDFTEIDFRSYVWDAAGNKTAMNDLLAPALDSKSFTYDSVNRLVTSQTAVVGPTIAYTLDGVGNRLAVTGGSHAGAYSMSATIPPADAQVNQYTATPFDTRESDANGNLTSAGPQEFHYDFRNRLVRVWKSSSGETTSFKYDCFGRRVEKATATAATRYYHTGEVEIEEQDDSNMTVASYVWGVQIDELLYMDRGGQEFFYHADDLGSIRKVTGATGCIVEQYRYGDYGEPSFLDGSGVALAGTQIGNSTLFTGRRYDAETGLYCYRTRYLDPTAGRFTTRDTIGIWGDQGNMGNGFAYVGNNPWSHGDPDGRGPSCPCPRWPKWACITCCGITSAVLWAGVLVVPEPVAKVVLIVVAIAWTSNCFACCR
ncbi:MAG: autotransporter-associated beta strand repeat-containing protein [Verrucomicrobia bacterium]|nr:autotransporter-associated beta strand repeat-containing protein [Verrucomicrobiota bacterium]